MNSLMCIESTDIQGQIFSSEDLEYYLLLAYNDAVSRNPGFPPEFFVIDEFFEYHLSFTNRSVFNVGVLGYQVNRYEMTFELIEEALDLMRASFINMIGEEVNSCQNTLMEEI